MAFRVFQFLSKYGLLVKEKKMISMEDILSFKMKYLKQVLMEKQNLISEYSFVFVYLKLLIC